MEEFFQTNRPVPLKMDVSDALDDSEIAAVKPQRQASSSSAFALCTAALEEVVEEAAKQSAAFEDKYGEQADEVASLASKQAQQLDAEHRRLQRQLTTTREMQASLTAQSKHDIEMQIAAVTEALSASTIGVTAQQLGEPTMAAGIQAAVALHNSEIYLARMKSAHDYHLQAVPVLEQRQKNVAVAERLSQLCQQVMQSAGKLAPGVTMADLTVNQLHAALHPLRQQGSHVAAVTSTPRPETANMAVQAELPRRTAAAQTEVSYSRPSEAITQTGKPVSPCTPVVPCLSTHHAELADGSPEALLDSDMLDNYMCTYLTRASTSAQSTPGKPAHRQAGSRRNGSGGQQTPRVTKQPSSRSKQPPMRTIIKPPQQARDPRQSRSVGQSAFSRRSAPVVAVGGPPPPPPSKRPKLDPRRRGKGAVGQNGVAHVSQ